MRKLTFVLLIAFFAVAVLRAQEGPPQGGAQRGGAGARAQKQAQAEAAERGRKTFVATCAGCHGEDATGGRGSDLIRSALVRHDKNGDLLSPVITAGRPDRGMPGFPLGEKDLSDIDAFLHAQIDLYDMHTRVPGGYPDDIPASRLATGSAEAGKAYFYGAGGCSKCHSPTGDLAGIAKKYSAPDLQQRFLYPAGKPSTATVTLPSGKKFSGTLLLKDEFTVAIRDADGWYHSWPLRAVKVEVEDPLAWHFAQAYKYTNADMHNLFTYLETLK
ncbi:MAG: cytochrome c [Acidobacteriia bacterium]|nr:cytochrome c [Terriglobia bacterium]